MSEARVRPQTSSKVQNAMRNASVRRKSEVKTKDPVEEEEEKVEKRRRRKRMRTSRHIAEFNYEAEIRRTLDLARRYSQG